MATRTLPANLDGLLGEIEVEWRALQEVVRRLSPTQMTAPDAGGWSPKDNLAHLSAWMNFLLKSYMEGRPAHVVLGIDEQKFKSLDEDGENAILFERSRARPVDEVLRELDSTYQATLQKLKQTDFSELMKPLREGDPQARLLIDAVLGNTSEHFREHRLTIARALKGRKA